MMNQLTIENPISCFGIGVHSGNKTQVTLRPASENVGIVFIRTDVSSVYNKILATYSSVFDTSLSTSIKNNANISVSTIEHLMAAIWGCGIDNLIVEIDGSEVPIMDGSSKPFVFMLECAGFRILNAHKKYLKLLKEIRIEDSGTEIFASPSESMVIDLTIDFANKVIGKQKHTFCRDNNFKEEIADSRTFGFLQDLNYLQSKGLAKGASLDNAIGIDKDTILNHEGLRHDNEFARHKMLDLMGDLYTTGAHFIGTINGYKTSHHLNNQFLRKVFSDPYAYSFINAFS
jgi:UDP-3-O-[3-hydroxymyristoyl] N-acetylglucosamine deacetylase